MRHADPSTQARLTRLLLAALLSFPWPAASQTDSSRSSPLGRETRVQLESSSESLQEALLNPGAAAPDLPDLDAALARLADPGEKAALSREYAALKQRREALLRLQGAASPRDAERLAREAAVLSGLKGAELEALVEKYRQAYAGKQAEAKDEAAQMAKDLEKAVAKLPPHLAKTFDAPLAELNQAVADGDWAAAKGGLDSLFDRLQRASGGDPETAAQLTEARAAFGASFDKASRALTPVALPHLAGKDWRLDKGDVPLPKGKDGQPAAGSGSFSMRLAFWNAASNLSSIFEGHARRELFKSERGRQTDQLASDAFMALRKLGKEDAAAEFLPLARIQDPAAREKAMREFLEGADRVLEAERLKRIPPKASPDDQEKALEAAMRKHPEFGVYLMRRARYQVFVAESVADRSVTNGTEFGNWETGARVAPGTKTVFTTRKAAQGRFAGLEWTAPDGSTRFEGTDDGQRKLIQSRDASNGTSTSTLAELREGRIVKADTAVYDASGKVLARERVTDGGRLTVSETFDPKTGAATREVRTDEAGRKRVKDLLSGEQMTVEPDGRAERVAGAAEKQWRTQTGTMDANGNFTAQTISLADGRKLRILGSHTTEVLDAKGRREAVEVRVGDIGAGQSPVERQKAAWAVAKQLTSALGKDDKDSRHSFPLANFLAENVRGKDARLSVDKDGKIYVIETHGDQKRIQTAEFKPTTPLAGASFGEGLIVTEDSWFNQGQGELKLARQVEYLPGGDKLFWGKHHQYKPGGVFTADKEVVDVTLTYLRRQPNGTYQDKARVTKDTIVNEIAGSSALAVIGQGFVDAPVLGHVLKGGGFVGKTLYSGVVGGGQAIVGGVSGSTAYEVESWASLEKAWGWTSDSKTDLARTLSPEAITWIDNKVWEVREEQVKEHLKKQGVTPKTRPDYDQLVRQLVYIDNRSAITNDERLAVLKDKYGAGTYGGRLVEQGKDETGIAKVLLYGAGGGMYIAEGTAESLPLVLATAGLGRIAAVAPAANATAVTRFGVSAAHYTNIALGTSLTGTWVVGGLDNAGQFASAVEAGDATRAVQSGSHMLTDMFFAAATVHGVRRGMQEAARNKALAERLGLQAEKLKAMEAELRLQTEKATEIKPAVDKVSPDGTAKILEFQLDGTKGGQALKSPAEIAQMTKGLPESSKNLVIEYERAYREAYVDSLTGIRNRKFVDHSMKEMMQERHHRLLGDVDHFKSVNDRFGHEMGDKVLKEVAKIWAEEHSRAGNKSVGARFGGEEFFGNIPGERKAALDVANRINERVRTEVHTAVGLKDPITISIGLAEGVPAAGPKVQDAFREGYKLADKALYQAKNSGRDRVVGVTQAGEHFNYRDLLTPLAEKGAPAAPKPEAAKAAEGWKGEGAKVTETGDPFILEVKGANGTEAIAKLAVKPYEVAMLRKAGEVKLPDGIDNVHIPKLLAEGQNALPPGTRAPERGGVMVMEKAKGVPLSDFLFGDKLWQGPKITAEEFANLQRAFQALNEKGVHHTDLKNPSNIHVWKDKNGRTQFEIIDWGGPADPKMRMSDAQGMQILEGYVRKAGILSNLKVEPPALPKPPPMQAVVPEAKPAPAPKAPAQGPTGTIKTSIGGKDVEMPVVFDRVPGRMEATFMAKNAAGEAVVVKTPVYKGVESQLSPQELRVKMVTEMNNLREAGKLKAEGKLPEGFNVAEPIGLGTMDAATARKVYGRETGEMPTLLMKRAEGVTMQRYLNQVEAGTARLTSAELALFEKGIKALNRNGITHNDLHPGNVLVHRGPDGKVRFTLVDFGEVRTPAKSGNRWSDYLENDANSVRDIRSYFEEAWKKAAETAIPAKPAQSAQKPAAEPPALPFDFNGVPDHARRATKYESFVRAENGNVVYRDKLSPALKPGPAKGARMAVEVDPATGKTVRTWMETVDQQGRVIQVHQKTPVDTGHVMIDPETGKPLPKQP